MTYQEVDGFCHVLGFGTGKDGLGLFEIAVHIDGMREAEYVPFTPPPECPPSIVPMDTLPLVRLPSPLAPVPSRGYVVVSSGSWAKGTLSYAWETVGPFDDHALEILVRDLSELGIGEDTFVEGFRYRGIPSPPRILKVEPAEFYPVSRYDPERGRWTDLC